jgi:hypothetical protein
MGNKDKQELISKIGDAEGSKNAWALMVKDVRRHGAC